MSDEPKIEPPVPEKAPRAVGFLLSQLGFATSKRFLQTLEPIGIHPREFLLLRFLAASDDQSQQALAERLGVPPSRMVAVVDRLEEARLVERRPDPADRRIRAVHLTPKGRKVLRRAIDVALEFDAQICSRLDENEREQLIDLLHKLQPELLKLREADTGGARPLPGVHPGFATDHPGSPEE
jgi:DNA-binding MarR family transcriptional regulator